MHTDRPFSAPEFGEMHRVLEPVLCDLESAGQPYCILHDWGSRGATRSDVDILVARDAFSAFERALAHHPQARIVQLIQHEATGFYFVLAVEAADGLRLYPIDVATDYRRDGRVYFTAEELLADRQRRNGGWVSGPIAEFAYLLVKRVSKEDPQSRQILRLRELLDALAEEGHTMARTLFGTAGAARLLSWLDSPDLASTSRDFSEIHHALRRETACRDPLNRWRYWLPELRRRWRRWRQPTGLFVAVLGPDGAGKSGLVRELERLLGRGFRRTLRFHLRPGILSHRSAADDGTDPYARPPYPRLWSVAKLAYLIADYLLGYGLRIRPALVRSTLVIADRYYDDLLADARRYRYAGALWLAQLARRLIPRPDLYLMLDAPGEQLRRRKEEVTLEEAERQRKGYRALAAMLSHVVVIDAARGESDVAQQAMQAVVDALHLRYLRRRPRWFGRDLEGSRLIINSLRALVSESVHIDVGVKGSRTRRAGQQVQIEMPESGLRVHRLRLCTARGGRHYLVPAAPPRLAVQGLALYIPHTTRGKWLHGALAVALYSGLAGRLLPEVQLRIPAAGPDRLEDSLLLEHLSATLGSPRLVCAVSLGTPGVDRKPVIQLMTPDGGIVGYAKVGHDARTNALVRNEAEILRHLARTELHSVAVPRLLSGSWWQGRFVAVVSPPAGPTHAAGGSLSDVYLAALRDLRAVSYDRIPLQSTGYWTELTVAQRDAGTIFGQTLARGMAVATAALGNAPLPFHFCHGDFAPWNARLAGARSGRRLFLFDWEHSGSLAPPAWDMVHFYFMTSYLLRQWPVARISRAFTEDSRVGAYLSQYCGEYELTRCPAEMLLLLYGLGKLAQECRFPGQDLRLLWDLASLVHLLCSRLE